MGGWVGVEEGMGMGMGRREGLTAAFFLADLSPLLFGDVDLGHDMIVVVVVASRYW